jgi:hypothetical protein
MNCCRLAQKSPFSPDFFQYPLTGIGIGGSDPYFSDKIIHYMKHFILLLTATLLFSASHSQQLSKEATHEITKQANKGYLYEPKINQETNELEMTYVTKASGKKAKFETYKFDLNFNFKGMQESEVPLEKLKGYRSDKGEEYTLNAVTVESNLMGTLVLRRKIVTRKWNWFWGGYDTKVKLAEKLKPKTEDGNKIVYLAHTEQDELETVLVIGGAKGNPREDAYRQYKEFHFLRFDTELNQVSDQVLKFDYPQYLVGINSAETGEEDEVDAERDILLVFAPAGGALFKKNADPNAGNYTFVRVSYDGKVKQKISFQSKASVFNGDMFLTSGNDVYIIGAAGSGDKTYFNEKFASGQPVSAGRSMEANNFSAKGFQIVKIQGDQLGYVALTTLDEFEARAKSPASQKKKPEYTGKRFLVRSTELAPNGDLFIAGQKYNNTKNGIFYEDIIMMQFNNQGSLKAAYGVKREESSKGSSVIANMQMLSFSKDGNNLYWMIMEMAGLRQEKELGESKMKTLIYPSVSKIDINNATIGEFVQFGQGKTDYYLNNKYPLLPIGKDGLVFLGENKSGKTLWFAKMPLD